MNTSQLGYDSTVAKTDAIMTNLYDLIDRINEQNPLIDEQLLVAVVMDLMAFRKIKWIN